MRNPGLSVIPNFINQYQHDWLVAKIDSLPWDNRLKRRTQHYGWTYRYNRSLLRCGRDYKGELPEWLKRLSAHLSSWLPNCDQVLVNEYLQGQKITAHIDHSSNFGKTIISLSLCSTRNPNISKGWTSGCSNGQSQKSRDNAGGCPFKMVARTRSSQRSANISHVPQCNR